jgi:hypothetical protein
MSPPVGFRIERADLSRAEHAVAWADCTNAYAMDVQGRSAALEAEVLARSVSSLASHPTFLGFLAWHGNDVPAGLVTCFRAWGTFAAKPLVNVHDLAVKPAYRGCAAGRASCGCSRPRQAAQEQRAAATARQHHLTP